MGNPFTHIKGKNTKAEFIVDTRSETISKYKEWIPKNIVFEESFYLLVRGNQITSLF